MCFTASLFPAVRVGSLARWSILVFVAASLCFACRSRVSSSQVESSRLHCGSLVRRSESYKCFTASLFLAVRKQVSSCRSGLVFVTVSLFFGGRSLDVVPGESLPCRSESSLLLAGRY